MIGKTICDAWIADAIIDHETDLIHLPLGWDAERIDPLGCSVIFRCERDGAPLLVSQWKVSDLPAELTLDQHGREVRQLPWNERTISIVVPRGPRHTEWGVSLLGPDGTLLDELTSPAGSNGSKCQSGSPTPSHPRCEPLPATRGHSRARTTFTAPSSRRESSSLRRASAQRSAGCPPPVSFANTFAGDSLPEKASC